MRVATDYASASLVLSLIFPPDRFMLAPERSLFSVWPNTSLSRSSFTECTVIAPVVLMLFFVEQIKKTRWLIAQYKKPRKVSE